MVLLVEVADNVRVYFDEISEFEAVKGSLTKVDAYALRSAGVKKAILDGHLIVKEGEADFRLKGSLYRVNKDGIKTIDEVKDMTEDENKPVEEATTNEEVKEEEPVVEEKKEEVKKEEVVEEETEEKKEEE